MCAVTAKSHNDPRQDPRHFVVKEIRLWQASHDIRWVECLISLRVGSQGRKVRRRIISGVEREAFLACRLYDAELTHIKFGFLRSGFFALLLELPNVGD
jgi:hypothetical protein